MSDLGMKFVVTNKYSENWHWRLVVKRNEEWIPIAECAASWSTIAQCRCIIDLVKQCGNACIEIQEFRKG